MSTPDVLTRAEVADGLGLTPITITRWVEEGRITATRRDPWMFGVDEYERLREELLAEAEARVEWLSRSKKAPAAVSAGAGATRSPGDAQDPS